MFRNTSESSSTSLSVAGTHANSGEKGAALATALLMLALLSAIAMTVLAVVRTETRIAGSDLKRTQTYYAAASGIEKMTSDFSQLYTKTTRPTSAQLYRIRTAPPTTKDKPIQLTPDRRSPRNKSAKRATNTTLSLSIGATLEASPSCKARK